MLVSALAGSAFMLQAAAVPEQNYPLQPFEYGEVKLEPGEWLDRVNAEKEFYLSLSNDDLLKGFRERAGLPAPGAGLTGWYGKDIFHVFGQLLAGYSRMYASTGDVRCLEKANALLEGWAETIDDDGYFYYSTHPNAKHYVFEKMSGGLVDCYLYCNNPKALECLSKITDWAIKNLDQKRTYGQHIDSQNGEWYTLSENLYRAWLITGDEKYFKFAEFWEYNEFWDTVRKGEDPFVKKDFYHAYSHLNTFCSAAAAYKAKQTENYLNDCIAGYDFFRNTQCFVTGGFGPAEQLKSPEALKDVFEGTTNSFEVQCSTWASFKLGKYLISFTGEARFGDWVELLMINGIGASIPMTKDGLNYHYANYHPGGASKTNWGEGWWCCTGTRPQAAADFQNLVYFHHDKDLFVNLFTPSSLTWNGLHITQATSFPQDNRVSFSFSGSNSRSFTMGFRKAEWLAAAPVVKVNGQDITPVEDKGWLTVTRVWNGGDKLEIELPMEFKTVVLPGQQTYPAALKYGPVTMAVQYAEEYPIDALAAKKTPVQGEPLQFEIEGHPEWLLTPYYLIPENEPYFIYLDPDAGLRVEEKDIKKRGDWEFYATWHCNTPGAFVEITFNGTGIRWKGFKYDDAGKTQITLDGTDIETVDQYSPVRDQPFYWEKRDLEYGKHTVRFTLLEDRNPQSLGTWMNYTDFLIYNETGMGVVAPFTPSEVQIRNGQVVLGDRYVGQLITVNVYDLKGQPVFSQQAKITENGQGIRLPQVSEPRIIVVFDGSYHKIFTSKICHVF